MLCEYTTFYLSIHQLMDIVVISTLWAITDNTVTNICVQLLCGYMFLFLLCIYVGVESLSHIVTLDFTF